MKLFQSKFVRLMLLGWTFVALIAIAPQVPRRAVLAAGSIDGTVFRDYNGNGIRDDGTRSYGTPAVAALAVDTGIGGVLVTAYNAQGVAIASTRSLANGTYSLDLATVASANDPLRLEFTDVPGGAFAGPKGTNNQSTIQFVTAPAPEGSVINDLGLVEPVDYCEDNPTLATTCYVFGDQDAALVRNELAVLTFPFNSGSPVAPGADYVNPTNHAISTTAGRVGAVWGLAYSKPSQRLYTAAVFKRHVGFGRGVDDIAGTADDPATVYVIDGNLSSATRGTVVSRFLVPGATTNSHDPTNYLRDNDNIAWDAAGKTSLGGLAISEDGTRLYVMNLEQRRLYALNATTGTVLTSQDVPLNPPAPTTANPSRTCPAGDVRPFAVEYNRGQVYVGLVCSAESTQSFDDLWAYIYRVDPITLAFEASPAFQFQLNYPRRFTRVFGGGAGVSADWQPWSPTFASLSIDARVVYPQPIFSSIAFDGPDLVLGLRDRLGDQAGSATQSNPITSTLYIAVVAGDTLRACANASGGWDLESNSRCGGNGVGPQNTGQGPGGGEIYFKEEFGIENDPIVARRLLHDELSLGSLSQVPGVPQVVAAVYDPIPREEGGEPNTGGFRWFDRDGRLQRVYQVYRQLRTNFGKANGLGDSALMCQMAPVEIGNRVWRDDDRDGVQDPNEPLIAGVTVRLYDVEGSVIGTTITDSNGTYVFGNQSGQNATGRVYGLPLISGAEYEVRLDNQADYDTGPLVGLQLTRTQNDPSPNGTSRDSNGQNVTNPNGSPTTGTFPVATLILGQPGNNNHTYDFGFFDPRIGGNNDTPTPTATATATATPIPNSTATPTLTPTATNTPTLVPSPTTPGSTAVLLSSFTATRLGSQAIVRWSTTVEYNSRGFRVLRSPTGQISDAVVVSPNLISARSSRGASYSWVDPAAPADPRLTYWLVEVDLDGTETRYGPTRASLQGQLYRLWFPVSSMR